MLPLKRASFFASNDDITLRELDDEDEGVEFDEEDDEDELEYEGRESRLSNLHCLYLDEGLEG